MFSLQTSRIITTFLRVSCRVLLLIVLFGGASLFVPRVDAQTTSITDFSYSPNSIPIASTQPIRVEFTLSYTAPSDPSVVLAVYLATGYDILWGNVTSSPQFCAQIINIFVVNNRTNPNGGLMTGCEGYPQSSTGVERIRFQFTASDNGPAKGTWNLLVIAGFEPRPGLLNNPRWVLMPHSTMSQKDISIQVVSPTQTTSTSLSATSSSTLAQQLPSTQMTGQAQSGLFYGAIILVVLVLAVIVLVVLRREKTRPSKVKGKPFCINCGARLPPKSEFCNKCGSAQT